MKKRTIDMSRRPPLAAEPAELEMLERDPLGLLVSIDRLEIGPPRIQARRVTVPYTVVQNGVAQSRDLIFRYEQPVFDRRDPETRNLASMVGAQGALNYGLFAREIVFRGAFDRHDRAFLRAMGENTAREIFVKKFLEPNPFLRGAAAHLPPVRTRSYLRARLVFPDAAPPAHQPGRGGDRPGRRAGHAVLSSGGKDSLVTFGLLRELGVETHPIFINESGHHWFTALNSHRYFAANYPHTTRVWTNADRVFPWMLSFFPFIRPDFHRLRCDEYPIQLWTVPVFLFGALPLVRRRGLARVLIGDEIDTTRRLRHQGITHYDGIFDQSRYFDNVMSRYYRAKGWGTTQFSLIRPLSELLIEKILVERYPDLLREQVSCHLAHMEDGRVRPCGYCEKCRRIVGMVTAAGGDPQVLGYRPDQIRDCLEALSSMDLHQEIEGAQHLAYMLLERGLIARPGGGAARPRRRPEVLKLRFDPVRSPLAEIPADLREPVIRIWMQHAGGAVRREDGAWREFDPLAREELARPHPFEPPEAAPAP